MRDRAKDALVFAIACAIGLGIATERQVRALGLRAAIGFATVRREVPHSPAFVAAWTRPSRRRLVALLDAATRASARFIIRSAHRTSSFARVKAVPTLVAAASATASRRAARTAFVAAVASTTLAGTGIAVVDPTVEVAASVIDLDDNPFPQLPAQASVYAADGTNLGVLPGGVNRQYVEAAELPPVVRYLLLAAEDQRFFEHDGYDASAILRAAWANLRARKVTQGGSTITQQLAKRNFAGDDRTPLRKARELAYASALEDQLSKRELLDRYVNEVYFGAGAYGVAAAARAFFGADVRDLRPEQGALLAAVIRAPSVLDPWTRPEDVRVRRDAVLRAAATAGHLTPEQARDAIAAPLGVLPAPWRPAPPEVQLTTAIEDEAAEIEALGSSPEERVAALRRRELRIETSISPALQVSARDAVSRLVPPNVSSAVAMVEPGSGRVQALVAHQPNTPSPYALATRARRQPGSTFKPFAAVAALEAGLRPDQKFEGHGPRRFDLPREDWVVDNFDGADYSNVDLGAALRDSVNTAFAQLSVAVGADKIASVAQRAGVSEEAMGAPNERGPSLGLGGLRRGVSPLELAEGYATIAADGRHADAKVIDRILERDGTVVYQRPDPGATPVIDPAVAGAVRTMLHTAVAEGTGQAARVDGFTPMGKTGTSQDRADAWFVGSLPHLTAAVWVGHSDRREPMPTATGGATAAPIWRAAIAPATGHPAAFSEPPPFAPGAGIPLPKTFSCDRRCDRD